MTSLKPYVILGATGNTGAQVALTLLSRNVPVRVVVRDLAKGKPWNEKGAQVVVADMLDKAKLADAFSGSAGAYVLNPPAYQAEDMFLRAEELALSVLSALSAASVPRVIVLSAVGAHLGSGTGNIVTNHCWEEVFSRAPFAVTFVRAAWFMENWRGVSSVVKEQGILPSFLSPLDRTIPMVAVADIGRVCAESLLGQWSGTRVIELEGPASYSPNDVASAFSGTLGRPVTAIETPESEWERILSSWAMSSKSILAWCEMLRAFNKGVVGFEGEGVIAAKGQHTLSETVAAFFPENQ